MCVLWLVPGVAGVGFLVAEKWIENVIETRRVSERMMLLRLRLGKAVLNIISVYAPQAGRIREEKEEFYTSLRQVLE